MNRFMVRNSVGICATLTLHLTLWGPAATPQVKTSSGVVEGKDDGTVRAFLGILYAFATQKNSVAGDPWECSDGRYLVVLSGFTAGKGTQDVWRADASGGI